MRSAEEDGFSCCLCFLRWFSIFVFCTHLGHCGKNLFAEQTLVQNYYGEYLSEKYNVLPFDRTGKPPCSSHLDNTASCCGLNGIGSLNDTCILNSSLYLENDLCIYGSGSLEVSPYTTVTCPVKGCEIYVNISGFVRIGSYAKVIAGSVVLFAANITIENFSAINTTSLGGPPPAQTSGTPVGHDGAGGGHGGRGASCLESNLTNWGGDVYSWSTLSNPWSYGSKGGSTSDEYHYGGDGGGRIKLIAKDLLRVDGSVAAEGGTGGNNGGGGSGGSIMIHAYKLKGNGTISAAGGSGWGGGGGGRISTDCYSIQDVTVTVHGGVSLGCPKNSGAAGTVYDGMLMSLKVSNDNLTTRTETPLLDFPTTYIWSNVFVECNAKALIPLLWTRVQVRGQIRLLNGGSICFGLSDFPVSEFEVVAEELLLSDSILQVYGAFRMYVKMLLMWNSMIAIDGGGNEEVSASVLEARNLVVLRHNSTISSNADLGFYGQGLLKLSGDGDAIRAERLLLSSFYNIEVSSGSLLQAPLDDDIGRALVTRSRCESQTCPIELIFPPDDCHLNNSLSFTLQVCRVDDLVVNGTLRGAILHIHRAGSIVIEADGIISASNLGCEEGIGRGQFSKFGPAGGAGHGGKGGSGYYNGILVEGGREYGDSKLPCELGSGSGGSSESEENVSGGGLIVIGSMKWPLPRLEVYGSLKADGESYNGSALNDSENQIGGLGGGSGGTILLFLQSFLLETNSSLSVRGGNGGPIGGGGGGGGRLHFDWSNIATGDEYVQIAVVNSAIESRGGSGNSGGHPGHEGTITGNMCPKGLYGIFFEECPVGTYKDTLGSDSSLCVPCSLDLIPLRADFIYVRGGVTQPNCPYRCLSKKYKMPNCYTPLEELVYTFGGPLPFALLLSAVVFLLAILLSALRIKMLGNDIPYKTTNPIQHDVSDSFPYLLSLAEVTGSSRAEETNTFVHRMYFMGPNTFREPWHLPHSPPEAIIGLVYEDAFNRFIDEINSLAAYEWWEGSVHIILSVVAYPCAWSWKQWRRRKKIYQLKEYVRSDYDHSCLRSCRSRALYKGMKVGSTPDLMVAYIDFFLGGDEKRLDAASCILKRFPMCILLGGDGSFMSPYIFHSDFLLTDLLTQNLPLESWNRLVEGFNARLRTVRQGFIRPYLRPVILWINSHTNPQLDHFGLRIELGWFQMTASGYYQLGIFILTNRRLVDTILQPAYLDLNTNDSPRYTGNDSPRTSSALPMSSKQFPQHQSSISQRLVVNVNKGIINLATLPSLHYKKDYLFPLSLLLQNTMPIGYQDTLQLLISVMLLGDLAITILLLLQFYWMSLGAFLAILLILPLSFLSPFPAGLNALFSRGPKRSPLARIYALWNVTSFSNTIVALLSGTLLYFNFWNSEIPPIPHSSFWRRDANEWWVLPIVLLVVKVFQAGLVNWHIANLEIPDFSLFSEDPKEFWEVQQ